MITINTIQKDINAFFAEVTDENVKKSQIKSIEYINQLAGLTSTNISRWNIISIFGTGEGNLLVANKNEINKRFFARMNVSSTAQQEKVEDYPELINAINYQTENKRKKAEESLLRDIARLENEIEMENGKLIESLKKFNILNNNLQTLQGTEYTSTLKEEFGKILDKGCWINPVYEDGYLWLNTKNNVTISYKNKQALVDIDVNLGQLAVKIHIESLTMHVAPYKNNIRVSVRTGGAYFHPHISRDGAICWGNALTQVNNWSKEGNLHSILDMLYSLLFNYNDSNPYMHIQKFKTDATKSGRCVDFLRHPDKKKKKIAELEETIPIFHVGEAVEYELACGSDTSPRWNDNIDNGASGRWRRTTISSIENQNQNHRLLIRLTDDAFWSWPLQGHDDYSVDQWTRPGFLKKCDP